MSLNQVSKNVDLNSPQGKDRLYQTLELMSQRIATLEAEQTSASSSATQAPVGSVVWSTLTPSQIPVGWLVCDGSTYQAATYPALHTYYVANGYFTTTGSTFDVPDLRGRTAKGVNDSTLPAGQDGTFTGRPLANASGSEMTALTTTEMPSHAHVLNESSHNHGVSDPGHTHSLGHTPNANVVSGTSTGGIAISGSNTGSNTTGISVNFNTTGITMNNTGGGAAFSTEDPSMSLLPIVRAK